MLTKARIVRVKNTKISLTFQIPEKITPFGYSINDWFFETCANKGKKKEKKRRKCLP
jgi:hypothetical protein